MTKEEIIREFVRVTMLNKNESSLNEMTLMDAWKALPKKFMFKMAKASTLSPLKWSKFAMKTFKEENLEAISEFMAKKLKEDGFNIDNMEKPEDLSDYLDKNVDKFLPWMEEWYNEYFKPEKPIKLS